MAYIDPLFLNNINKLDINTIFELGSRDLLDAIKLSEYFNCKVYAFECNPDCIIQCKKNININDNVILIEKAVSLENKKMIFYPFDLSVYDNMGSSSMLKIDFSTRNTSDPDYNKPNPQKEIEVDGIRLDTFTNIPDLLCIDLQGYELNAIKSLGDKLNGVKYIITECSINSTYIGGASFIELNDYLNLYGFKYKVSNKFNYDYPDLNLKYFSEFDALFIKSL